MIKGILEMIYTSCAVDNDHSYKVREKDRAVLEALAKIKAELLKKIPHNFHYLIEKLFE